MLTYKRGPLLMYEGVWVDEPGAPASGPEPRQAEHTAASDYLKVQAAVHGSQKHLQYHYKTLPALLPFEELRTCYALAAKFAEAVCCPAPVVETFRVADHWEKNTFSRNEPINGLYCAGETLNGMPVVHVRVRSHGEMLRTIAHEVKHVEQHHAGRSARLTSDEREAEADVFAADMVAAFDLPAHARLWTAKRWEEDPPKDNQDFEMFDWWWHPRSGRLYQNIRRHRIFWDLRRVVRL